METVTVGSQLYAFAFTVLAGLVLGLLFDWYRIARGILRPGRALTFAGDLLFWLVAAASAFSLLLVGNWGDVRAYAYLGIGLGLFLYFQLFHTAVVVATVGLLRLLGAVLFTVTYVAGELLRAPYLLIRSLLIQLGADHALRRLTSRARWRVRRPAWFPIPPGGPGR